MTQKQQKPAAKWWKKSINSRLYRIREYSAIFIVIYIFYLVISLLPHNIFLLDSFRSILIKYNLIFIILGLTGSVIHSILWFAVTPKLIPVTTSKAAYTLVFILLITLWIYISTLILSPIWN